ncbi:MAG: electron transport complex subunit RsxE [Candidatus Zixiibacteriota bacterium]
MNIGQEFTKGILKENPVLVYALGLCPALAVTTSANNGLGMGIAASFVLLMSNFIISLIKKLVPDKIRIPVFITVIATFVTIVKLVMAAYVPALSKSLGIFIPLIVVNCIILGRAEAFASKNGIFASIADGLGMGLGFTLVLIVIGGIREILGSGTFFGMAVMGESASPAIAMILPPGGFLTIGLLIGLVNLINNRKKA